MLISAALAILLAPPISQGRVSYQTDAKAHPAVLEELGPKFGLHLESGALGEHVLIVAVEDVPTEEVMKRIAQATNAEWEKTEKGYRLIQTAEIEARLAKDRRT